MKYTAFFLLLAAQALHAQSVPSATTYLTDSELRRAIEAAPEEQAGRPGLYVVRLSSKSEYPVVGVRRTTAGKAEVHAEFTDVWYVIEGAATLVTGALWWQALPRLRASCGAQASRMAARARFRRENSR